LEGAVPNYEYICQQCRKRFSIFISYKEYDSKKIHCPHCSSENVQRRINRIRVLRSNESRMAAFTDNDRLDSIDENPRALGKMMREMQGEVGEEMGPEFDEVVDRLEKGQTPDQIEQELPDLDEGGVGDSGVVAGDDLD
jgi:putative FmdB family regulatory protein